MTDGRDGRVPVVITGGGPVGMVAALELGRRGVRCVLLNDRPETASHPKANAISSRTMEHLRRLGVAKRLRPCGLDDDHPTDLAYVTRLTGFEIGRYRQPSRAEALAEAAEGRGYWASPEPPHRCSQIFLERELKRAVDALPAVEARFGWRLEAFHDVGSHVEVTAVSEADGAEARLAADYLVACDGAGSRVRRQLGIELAGEAGIVRPMLGGPMYATYFEAAIDPAWLAQPPAWQYWILNPEIRALMVPVDSHGRFLFHAALGRAGGAVADPVPLIHKAAGTAFPLRVISSVNWTAGYALVAEHYRQGRVFLAGDAAHLFTPTGGMGMNTGVDDAVNLGWKLAAVTAGWGGEALLASYEAERRPIGQRNVAFASGFADSIGNLPIGPAIEEDSPAGRAERAALKPRVERHAFSEFIIPGIFLGLRYADSPVIAHDGTAPPADNANSYVPVGWPGARAPHLRLGADALYDRLGAEFTLLRLQRGGADPAPLVEAAAGRGVPLTVLDVPGEEGRALYGAGLVLVRPDQHVAWRGDRPPANCAALWDRLRGAPLQ